MKKSLFFTFCFSFIPGAGQMYQEYMKRGLSITLLAAFFTIITIVVNAPLFFIPILIIVMYSFFDTYHIRNSIGTDKMIKDEYIWQSAGINIFDNNFKIAKKNSLLGISLILIGVYLIFNNIIVDMVYETNIIWLHEFVRGIRNYLPSVVVSAISIAIGIKFINNK